MSRFKITFNIILVVIITLFVGIFTGIFFQRSVWTNQYHPKGDKLQYTLDMLESKYVDSLSRDSLTELVIPMLLSELDPHSEYIPKSELTTVNESLAGKFDGIGVMFNMLTDTAQITNVISGGPSSKVGIAAGDRIITVNDSVVAGRKLPSDKVVSQLRDPKGTKVKLGLQRGNNDKLIHITVTRGEIPMRSVEAAFIIKPGIGYIRVSRFAATTYKEFMAALVKLQSQGMNKVILDLRDNGGGLLDQAILMANEFLGPGQGIVYTQGAKSARREQKADGKGQFQNLSMVVMMSPESASASEIFAGAMQDNDRATIVGLRSFGKGLIQEQFDYPDGSAARITIAHYYTPLGRSIQKPYTKGSREEYQTELWRRYNSSELLNADSIAHDSTQLFITPKGRTVYGGGGIHPDLFVPLDTTSVSPYFKKLVNGNYIFKYATKFTDEHREQLNKVDSFVEFEKLIGKTNMIVDFVLWADRQGVRPSDSELNASRKYILAQLKAYIGRNTPLEDNALYYYFYPVDNTMIRSVESLEAK